MEKPVMDKTYHRIQMARSAYLLSLFSLVSVFIAPFVLPCILAPISIIIAILSRGADGKLSPRAGRACLIAGAVLVITFAALVYSAVQLTQILADPEKRRQADELLYRTYGYRLEDILPLLPSFLQR